MDDLARRVAREKEAHNAGIDRDSYRTWFSQVDAAWKPIIDRDFIEGMGDLKNASVLEIGSGGHFIFKYVPTPPTNIECINISEAEIEKGRHNSAGQSYRPNFHVMDAHDIRFPDNSFDVVYGWAILHHLNLDVALPEIDRVLKPGGRIVFHEPLDMNPVGRLVRLLTPSQRTPDEEPFRLRHIRKVQQHFDVDIKTYALVSVAAGLVNRFTGYSGLIAPAVRLDRILSKIPGARLLSRQILFHGTRKQTAA